MTGKKEKERRSEAEAEAAAEAVPASAEGGAVSSQPDGLAPEAAHPLPPEALPALEELERQLAQAQSQAAEYKDGWQRAVADFQNYRRRVQVEKDEAYQTALGHVIKRYLPILDDLERALQNKPADPWAEGIELIYRKLKTLLENEGVRPIEAEGQMFDPNIHEAISQEPAEGVESGTVIGVVQNGYMLGERVLRPATVRVAQ
jgi:molecular chaperone GrpE